MYECMLSIMCCALVTGQESSPRTAVLGLPLGLLAAPLAGTVEILVTPTPQCTLGPSGP